MPTPGVYTNSTQEAILGVLRAHDSCNSARIKQGLRQEQWMLTPGFTFCEHKISRSSDDLLTSMHGAALCRLCLPLHSDAAGICISPRQSYMNVALPDSAPSLCTINQTLHSPL